MKAIFKWLSFMAGIIIMFIILYNYVFFVIVVPSPSMHPTIKVGDRIITSRIHDIDLINTGDILVFYSEELEEILVKRVIGLPNDTVEINSKGEVFVNNKELNEPYVKVPDTKSGSFKVPDKEYFFLGDYREHSYDSRSWNNPYILRENIIGKAEFILFPFNRISNLNNLN